MSPWVWSNNESTGNDSFVLNKVQGVHVDYWEIDPNETGWDVNDNDSDCRGYGSNNAALTICAKKSSVSNDTLVAGQYFYGD